MNRRGFIKQYTGGIPVIRGKVVFIVLIALFFFWINQGKLTNNTFAVALPALEKESSPSSFFLFLKLFGIVLGLLVALTLLQILLEYVSKKAISLIPQQVKKWDLTRKNQMALFYHIAQSSFLIYYCLLKDQYLLLLFGQAWIIFCFFKKNPEARQTN